MANQQMLDYIKQEEERGVSREAIKGALIASGWQEAEIEEGFRALGSDAPVVEQPLAESTVEQVQEQGKSKNKSLMMGVVIVGAVLIVAATYFIAQALFNSPPENPAAVIEEEEVVEEESNQEEIQEMLSTIKADQLEFAEHLKSCALYEGLYTNEETGERVLARHIHGIIDGNCLHTAELPNNRMLECSYPDGSWIAVAEYHEAIANAQSVGTESREQEDGTSVVVTIVDGVEIGNPLLAAYENGDCTETF